MVYEFGHFRLDAVERELFCGNQPIGLTPKALAVLCLLVERAGHVVEKTEFMRHVWPDAFVEDANLTQSVALLRRVLCENQDRHEYIQTVYRRGYRFIASVNEFDRGPTKNASVTDKPEVRSGTQGLEKSAATSIDTMRKPSAPWPGSCASCKFLKRYTQSEEAQHLYTRGRCYWSKYTVEGLMKGINYFREAIKIDPNHSLAHVGLAGCYYRLSNTHLHPNEAMPKAKVAARYALRIEEAPAEALAEAHALLGLIETFYERDWPAAETEFKLAIALAPDSALAHNRYGWALGMLEHFDRGITELKRAVSLAPRSSEYHVGLGIILHLARRDRAAIDQAQLALDINPDFYAAHALLGMAYLQEQKFSEGLAELREAASLANVNWTLGYLGYAYAVGHNSRKAFDLLVELEQRSKQTYVTPFSLALIHAGLGDKEQALGALERTCEDRNEMFGFVKGSPEFDALRSDSRFETKLLMKF